MFITILKIIVTLLALGLLAVVVGFMLSVARAKRKEKSKISPLLAENRKKEEKLLEDLLKDIRENTDDWFIMDNVLHYGDAPIITNDRRSIGVLFNLQQSSIMIHLNLKRLQKFTVEEDDTVVIDMRGDHVTEFIHKAERYIDRRGRELEFFRKKLEERL